MAITYDKKMLKRLHNKVDGGKRKFAFKYSLFFSVFNFFGMLGFGYIINIKTDEDFVFDIFFVATWFVGSLIMFFVFYFINLKQYKEMKTMYVESIKYFEKHDPGFLKELGL